MPTRQNALARRPHVQKNETIDQLRKELAKERRAREMAEQRNGALQQQLESVNARLDEILQGQRKTEEFLQKLVRKLEKDVVDRDEKIEELNKQLCWFRKTFFGSTSEQSPLEKTDDGAQEEPASEDIQETKASSEKRKRGQQPGQKGHGRSDRTEIASEDQALEIRDCRCRKCGTAYRKLYRTENSTMIEMHIFLMLTNYRRHIYAPACTCEGGQIRTADPPPKLFDRTTLGNSVWLHLIVQKFLFGIPTNRTLKNLSLQGLPLAPGTVVGGFKRISEYLDALYRGIVDHCRGGEYWCADETTWRIFQSEQRTWWQWMIASEDAVVYLLDPSRSKRVPNEFFAGSIGTLMTDRLASYKGLHDGIRKAWCWVHIRRDFLRIYEGMEKLMPWARGWLEAIAKLFVLNEKRFVLWESGRTFGEQWTIAQNQLEEHLKLMERRWTEDLQKPKLHKQQKTVLRSLQRHWEGLTLFLNDPRVPLHNNRAERLLRNAVILRKNSYGSGSEWAGEFASKLFSIFQTWLINGLNPEALMEDFFNEVSKPAHPPPKTADFLPWMMSPERKQRFALPKAFRRPG